MTEQMVEAETMEVSLAGHHPRPDRVITFLVGAAAAGHVRTRSREIVVSCGSRID